MPNCNFATCNIYINHESQHFTDKGINGGLGLWFCSEECRNNDYSTKLRVRLDEVNRNHTVNSLGATYQLFGEKF